MMNRTIYRKKVVLGITTAAIALSLTTPSVAQAKAPVSSKNMKVEIDSQNGLGDFVEVKIKKTPGAALTLAGLRNSKEIKAQNEWQDFIAQYDPDGTILDQNDNFYNDDYPEWNQYCIYSEEMGLKLNQIAKKYKLKLHLNFSFLTPEACVRRVGKFLPVSALAGGYIYDDGTFQTDGSYPIVNGRDVDFQLRRSVKGVFDEVPLTMGDENDYKEWMYVTKKGDTVVIGMSEYHSFILGNFSNCYVFVNILDGTDMGITKKNLQKFADTIDFKQLKKIK